MVRRNFSAVQTILVLLGGHGQRLLPFVRALYTDVTHTIVVDATDEIARLGAAARCVNVQVFPLGVGETAQTLTVNLSPAIQKHIASVGGMSASGGMGQCIAVAHEAGRRLAASSEFQEFCRRKLVPKVRAQSGGALQEVRIIVVGSLAGATNSGTQTVIADAIGGPFLKLTSAIVVKQFLSTGGLTYENLGDRIWQNAGSSATELLAYITEPKRHPREVRRVRFLEFEVLGLDEALRDAYLAQVEQAAHCEAVKLDLLRRAPNDAINGRFGNVQTWEIAFGEPLDPAKDIASVAQMEYGTPLSDSLNREPSPSVVERLELEHQRVRLNNKNVEEVLADAIDRPVERSLSELFAPTFRDEVRAFAETGANERRSVAEYEILWAFSPRTCEEVDSRLQLQRRLLQLFREESKELINRREEAESELSVETQKFRKYHRLLNPEGVLGTCQSALTSTSRKETRLAQSAWRIKECSDQLLEIKAEIRAVDQCTAFVKRSYDYLLGKVSRIVDALRSAGQPIGTESPKVKLYSLDEQLCELWDAADEGPIQFLDALRRSVKYATCAGLASVTGATAPEIEEIAKAIASGRAYVTPAVPWGGRKRADQGRVTHVLPPVDDTVQKLLISALKRLDPEATIAFGNRAPVVVNIVSLNMRLVRTVADVLTPPYLCGLEEALSSGCSYLYLLNEADSLRSLEIEVTNGKVTLGSPSL
jgi:hypothetical protein